MQERKLFQAENANFETQQAAATPAAAYGVVPSTGSGAAANPELDSGPSAKNGVEELVNYLETLTQFLFDHLHTKEVKERLAAAERERAEAKPLRVRAVIAQTPACWECEGRRSRAGQIGGNQEGVG